MFPERYLRKLFLFAAVLCLIALPGSGEKISDIHVRDYLTDLAGVVDSATADRINALCGEVDRKTGAQIAVVTVRSLEGQPIENYAVDLFQHLGVGGKKDDRGVLLLIAPNDRRYRFEVGYGLEPLITDARAGDIGREMVPALRQGNYSAAIELGVNRVAALIAADRHVSLDHQGSLPPANEPEPTSGIPSWVLPLGFFVAIFVIRALRRAVTGGGRGRRGPGSWWWMGPMGGWGGGGWGSGGGSWGGGFGGSSGGFGGFGGGMSGGGGASGSW